MSIRMLPWWYRQKCRPAIVGCNRCKPSSRTAVRLIWNTVTGQTVDFFRFIYQPAQKTGPWARVLSETGTPRKIWDGRDIRPFSTPLFLLLSKCALNGWWSLSCCRSQQPSSLQMVLLFCRRPVPFPPCAAHASRVPANVRPNARSSAFAPLTLTTMSRNLFLLPTCPQQPLTMMIPLLFRLRIMTTTAMKQ